MQLGYTPRIIYTPEEEIGSRASRESERGYGYTELKLWRRDDGHEEAGRARGL
jgi:hypothetical protein